MKIMRISKIIIMLLLAIIISIITTNAYIIKTTKCKIIPKEELEYTNIDYIIILGAGIRGNNPSPMLEDRLITGINIYQQHKPTKILISGDHTSQTYDEVNVMKNYLLKQNIINDDIILDHAGISTYDSIYRAKEIFKAKKIIIVTQEYHLYRALYLADQLGIEAYGVAANLREYQHQSKRDIREFAARTKDFFKVIIKPPSKYKNKNIF